MKRLSLKTRLVLLHTGMMALVVCIVLALLFSISSREIVSNVENTLEASVFGAFEDMEYEDGRWDFDSDLMNLEDGVYLSVYDKNSQELLYGRIPYGFAYDLPFESGNLRTITAGENDYSVLDLEHTVNGRPVLIRGVISISDAERDFRYTLRLALILSPLMIFLTAVCGYLLSRRALYRYPKLQKRFRKSRKKRIYPNGSTWAKGTTKSTRWPIPLTGCWKPSTPGCSGKSSLPATLPMSCAPQSAWF